MELPLPPRRPGQVAFLGTPDDAVGPLRALVDAGHHVAVVVTAPDRRRGRGGRPTPSPVKAAADELGLAVSHDVDDVLGAGVDLGIVVAFGQIIRPHVLAEIPMINIHFSLLPRWRGAAPVERAILAGDATTGVCLMQMEEGLDTGGVYARVTVPIGPDDTAGELRQRLGQVGTELLLAQIESGRWEPVPQEGEPVYAHKLSVDDRRLEWERSATEVNRVVRIGDAHTTFRGERFKVHRAAVLDSDLPDDADRASFRDQPFVPSNKPLVPEPGGRLAPGEIGRAGSAVVVGCGSGALRLEEVQAAGRARQPAAAWANGAQPAPGERLGG